MQRARVVDGPSGANVTASRDDALTFVEACEYARIGTRVLRRLIANGSLPAERVGRRDEIRRSDLDALPRCAGPSCDRVAVNDGFCGHCKWCADRKGVARPEISDKVSAALRAAHADPARGPQWRLAMSRANRGRARPDVQARVAQMHAHKRKQREWHLALLLGRAEGRRTLAKRTDRIAPTAIRNAKNRLNGLKDDAHRPSKYHPDTRDLVRQLREAGSSWGEIEAQTGVPRDTARYMAGARQSRS
jgi:excisionase family DNA binding protein